MNKGFAYYFRHAFKLSAQTVWKNKNLLNGMLYFFTMLIARLTVILGAMVDLADVRAAKIAKVQQKIDVPQSLTQASQKPMWTMIVARVLEGLIYLGGFLLVSIPCGVVFALGLAIAQFAAPAYFTLICIIFAIPCLIIYLVYTIIVITIFAPTAYVIETNPGLSAGETVSVCVNSMKSRGKTTVFLCVFIPSLIIGAILGVFVAGGVLIPLLLRGVGFEYLLLIVWVIIALAVLGLTVPVFTTTQNLSLVLLFEDIALDPVNAQKRTAGINIRRITGARVDREEVADNLGALFDEGIEEKYPEDGDLVHKHRKKRKKKPVNVEVSPSATSNNAAGATATVSAAESDAELPEVDDYADEAPAPQTEQPVPQQEQQPQGQPQARPVPPPQGQPQGQPQARPVPPPQGQPQGQPQARPVPPPQGQPQARPVPPPQGQPQGQPQARPVPPPQGQPQARPVPPPQGQPQGQPQARPVPPPQGQPQGQPQARPVPPPQGQPQGQPQARPVSPPQGGIDPAGNGSNQ